MAELGPETVHEQTHPWAHHENGWSSALAAPSASLFALSNGYLGIRGTLEEGRAEEHPGTFLNGFHESIPLRPADSGHGDPRSDETMVPVAGGTQIELTVEGEQLDIETGVVLAHTRDLDLRTGVLTRVLRWQSPTGHEISLRCRRLVSLKYREIAAIEYQVESAETLRVTARSILTAEPGLLTSSQDPRAGSRLERSPMVPNSSFSDPNSAVLVHQTLRSRQTVAAGMTHRLDTGADVQSAIDEAGSHASWSYDFELESGRPTRFVKFLAYHWADDGNPKDLLRECLTSLGNAAQLGFDALVANQREALDAVWDYADIELEGDPEIQHALRYALFQIHQNATFADGHGIPAKGLTGRGYNGHTFWDTEIFLLPMLTHCAPAHVASALRWRASTLPQAQARALQLGLRGAAFPWRTISGAECAAYLPAGTAAFHVNADIAHALSEYVASTGDLEFEREVGAPLLVETARLWLSLGYHDAKNAGRFSIDGVTGPDEYSVLVDNNAYTNLMAQANLRAAIGAVERHGGDHCAVGEQELQSWRLAADAMYVPFDDELGIHLQDQDFARHDRFDFESIRPDQYPLFLHVPYFQLYRHQVVKQPDLALAMALRPDAFSRDEKLRNFAYYEALTVRDSSLAAGTLSVLAAELGDVQLAYDYLAEAALLDHHDLARNTADGLHLAALAGGWTAAIHGLAGARVDGDRLTFSPRLPTQLDRMAFTYVFRKRQLRVTFDQREANYSLIRGEAIEIEHWGHTLEIAEGSSVTSAIPVQTDIKTFIQPTGRAPARRLPRGLP